VIRQYLQIIEDRREVRFSFRASAAPSTNVNSATSDEVFNAFGFLPSRLDDDARAQSGLGLSWSLGGRYTPKFNQRLRGHFVARGQMTDYTNEKFDQALGGGEAGVRLPQTSQHGADITIAATYDHQFFAGDPYSTTAGARVNILKPLSQKFAVQTELSAGQITYKDRPDLDGPFYALDSQLIYAPKRSLQFTFGTSFAREDAEFGAAANDQYGVSTSVSWSAPYKLQLGLAPGFSLRNFDEVAALYGVLREDERFDLSARLGKRDWTIGGFYPSLIYRYTDNNSTVSLFTYDRHGVDLGFARLF
ncbi:MAG: surface lipoprotein assembly modifier, partial [Pseudomonadota bacterium]